MIMKESTKPTVKWPITNEVKCINKLSPLAVYDYIPKTLIWPLAASIVGVLW